MRQFHETYPEITTALRSQLNWTHHRIIMSRCKTEEERLFYLQLAATERYSTRELDRFNLPYSLYAKLPRSRTIGQLG